MKLEVSVEVSHPREAVYETYRDKLPELVSYLPNVREIQVKERREEGGKIHQVNRWKGGGDLPAMVRSFLSESMLDWDDIAVWDNPSFTCHWKTVSDALGEALHSEGDNYFEPLPGGRTLFRVVGDITVEGKKVPKVPRLIAGAVGPALETFLVTTVKPNLVGVAKGLEKYLDAKKG